MAVAAGTRFGAFEILGSLGAGGMGEVYRARDTRLKREVALKLLPEAVASDPDRIARFQREAEVLATLSHPHIAAIYGLEEAGAQTGSRATRALVLELVEGPTLAEVIARGPLPWADAVPLARQLAEALDYAHERGVLHRDLKPANIKVTPEGQVKVLDFGLAKLAQPPAPDATLRTPGAVGVPGRDQLPTITSPAFTQAGMLIGTAAYMAPEQARGQAVDKRADIWAFGCVLYEMLSGTRTFAGETISDTLAAVLRAEPDWAALPGDVPPAVTRLLRRCLTRDPKRRLRDIGEAVVELASASEEAVASDAGRTTGTATSSARPVSGPAAHFSQPAAARRFLPWAVALASAAVALAMAWRTPSETRTGASGEPPRTVQASINPPKEVVAAFDGGFALSPDGEQLAFVARDDEGRTLLWIRAMSSGEARAIPATDEAALPFWSPDGREVAFFSDGKIKRVNPSGGAPLLVANALPHTVFSRGATWLSDGTIVFTKGDTLVAIPQGGTPSPVQVPTADVVAFRWPQSVPGTRSIIVGISRRDETLSGIYQLDLDHPQLGQPMVQSARTDEHTALRLGRSFLATVSEQNLVARPLGAGDQRATSVIPVFASVANSMSWTNATASVDGRRVVLRSEDERIRDVFWFDRTGRRLDRVGTSTQRGYHLTPDGRVVAFAVANDLWSLDTTRGIRTRLTATVAAESGIMVSRDGLRFAYRHVGLSQLHVLDVRTGVTEQFDFGSSAPWVGQDWSPDERTVLLSTAAADEANLDLFLFDIRSRNLERLTSTPFNELHPRLAPDGRMMAYASDETGTREVYVRSLRGGAPVRASNRGGDFPMWRQDGRELVYLAPNGTFMSVTTEPNGHESPGEPKALFKAEVPKTLTDTFLFDMTGDGQRFLIEVRRPPVPLTLIDNWAPPTQN